MSLAPSGNRAALERDGVTQGGREPCLPVCLCFYDPWFLEEPGPHCLQVNTRLHSSRARFHFCVVLQGLCRLHTSSAVCPGRFEAMLWPRLPGGTIGPLWSELPTARHHVAPHPKPCSALHPGSRLVWSVGMGEICYSHGQVQPLGNSLSSHPLPPALSKGSPSQGWS